jgi:aspartyl-tRNA(Asn)/glutamyl-tRNA(Gln) amidotransferase subunit A
VRRGINSPTSIISHRPSRTLEKEKILPEHILEPISKTAERLRQRKISPVELTTACLAQIEKLNPCLNAFITITAESALAQARRAEKEIQDGDWRGPLHGIPLGLKDLIDTAGVRTTAASASLKDHIPEHDAEVASLLHKAGAILLGKHNMHEFAYGGSSLVSYYGEVRNPWSPEHIAGGSSGGSAAAVAAGLCYGAIGTDTAGSIREPAALCGVVGLKATYGGVSARGVIPLSPSLDHVGPMTRTVADAAILFAAIAGDAPRREKLDSRNLRIAIPRRFFYEDLDPEIARAVEEALLLFRNMTASIREIELAVDTDRTLQAAESWAVHAESVARNPDLYQPETLRRLFLGKNTPGPEMIERSRQLEMARDEIRSRFHDVDLLITPTTPIPAPGFAELQANPENLRPREVMLLRNTRPFNVWGLPAISVPCGFTKAGLPIGLQIAGAHGGEAKVFHLAQDYEEVTEWHKRHPACSL